MQNWTDLYKELATKIADNLAEVRWVDLWHNQVNFLQDEHPFPAPAVFLGFRTLQVEDAGLKVQNLRLEVDCYLFFETFLDSFHGAYNQEGALAFIETMDHLHALLHGSSGQNYSSMRRLAFNPVDTGGAGNLYQISFECLLQDYSAMKEWADGQVQGIDLERGTAPEQEVDGNGFRV